VKVGRNGLRAAYLCAAFGIYMVDQSSKAWAVRALRYGSEKTVINGLLDLVYAENRGVAFSQLQEGGDFGRWFFVTLAAAAAVAVLVYFFRTPRNDDSVLGACSLLLAGSLGNMTDRARFGYVIDFILAHAGSYHWPVFNVADISICTGAVLFAYVLFFKSKSREPGASRHKPQETKASG
jgi:signal peptidase II